MALSTNVYADCTKLKADCDAIVEAAQKLDADQKAQIKNYQAESTLQQQIIQDQAAELNSPLHNTLEVAAGTTVLITVLLIVTGHLK